VGEQAAAQQGRHLLGSALVVLGLPAMQRCHRQGMPQDKGQSCWRAESGAPLPGAETFHGPHQAIAVGRHRRAERCWRSVHGAVYERLAVVPHATDGHAAGMEIATAVKLRRGVVQSPAVSSCIGHLSFPLPAYHGGMLRGEASIIIKGLQATANSVRSCLAPALRRA
jgi:hypothetical protein